MQNMRLIFLSMSVQGRRGTARPSLILWDLCDPNHPVTNPPCKAADGEGGQALLLAVSSDSTHNRHPSPFSRRALSTQRGFSTRLFFLSSFLPGPSNPRKFPAESIHSSPVGYCWHHAIPASSGGKCHTKKRYPGRTLLLDGLSHRKTGGFGRERFCRFLPTPKHKPAGAAPAHRSRPWLRPRLRPRRFLLPPPPPETRYFQATGDPGAGRQPPAGPPSARRCRSSTRSILRAPSIAAAAAGVNAAAAARGGACSAHRARGSAPSPRPAGAEPGCGGGERGICAIFSPRRLAVAAGRLNAAGSSKHCGIHPRTSPHIPARPGLPLPRGGSTCPAAAHPRIPPTDPAAAARGGWRTPSSAAGAAPRSSGEGRMAG